MMQGQYHICAVFVIMMYGRFTEASKLQGKNMLRPLKARGYIRPTINKRGSIIYF